MNSCSYTWALY